MESTFTEFVSNKSSQQPLEVVVIGGHGRLGRAIQQAAINDLTVRINAIGRHDSDPGHDEKVDVVINASSPMGSARAMEIAMKKGVPIVECATGHDEEAILALRSASKTLPVLTAPNTSPGVALMRELLERAAAGLKGWKVEIRETHHEKKKDQPSGTARFFVQTIESARSEELPTDAVESIREGDVVGEHQVIFSGPNEEIRVEHVAHDRVLFGSGALRAARWVVGQPPGIYTIAHTLGQ